MKEFKIKVEGMVCGGCENRVKNAVGSIEGVISVTADHTTGIVVVTSNEDVLEKVVKEKIEDIGFDIVKED